MNWLMRRKALDKTIMLTNNSVASIFYQIYFKMSLSNPVSTAMKKDALKWYMSALDLRHFWKPPVLRRFVTHSMTQHFWMHIFKLEGIAITIHDFPNNIQCRTAHCCERILYIPQTKAGLSEPGKNSSQYIYRRWPQAAELHKWPLFKQ